ATISSFLSMVSIASSCFLIDSIPPSIVHKRYREMLVYHPYYCRKRQIERSEGLNCDYRRHWISFRSLADSQPSERQRVSTQSDEKRRPAKVSPISDKYAVK